MAETISSVMGLIPNLNTKSPTEIIEWLEIVSAALLQFERRFEEELFID